ncbi:MAG TPA: arginase [Candidatus Saccharimonadales bacterium]|nr:arginase [Candidatus Saccharimonadales bacterium]
MSTKSTPVTLIGVPLDLGAKNLGVDIGPQAFRYQDMVGKLASAGLAVADAGNIACTDRTDLESNNPHLRYAEEIVRVNEELATLTEQAVRGGRKVIVIGGDHSINLGGVSGASVALDGNLGLIYFDAHGDMNTDKTTLTGNIHGMHLASLMGFGARELVDVHGKGAKLATQNLLHIGGSDFDQAELDLVKREKLDAFMLIDLLRYGMGPLLDKIERLGARLPNIWVSLDLDAIDRTYAPGAGMPNAKGLLYREIATLAEYIGTHCNIIGVDVVEYNPLQDEQGKTAELGIELIAKFLGKNYSWYSNYLQRNPVG